MDGASPVFLPPPRPSGEVAGKNARDFPAKSLKSDILGDIVPCFTEHGHIFRAGRFQPSVKHGQIGPDAGGHPAFPEIWMNGNETCLDLKILIPFCIDA